ncbi:MAG: hypothetical protein H0X41_07775 [Chitinophagaceae bacterium]|nr:hypothetical protein [Chitinophagaceae bacterium]
MFNRLTIKTFTINTSIFILLALAISKPVSSQNIGLNNVTIFQPKPPLTNGELAAADILSSEVKKRTGAPWRVTNEWPSVGDVIILKQVSGRIKQPVAPAYPSIINKPESYRIVSSVYQNRKIILIEGTDERGVLFGAGRLLRMMNYSSYRVSFPQLPMLASAPDKAIRGHQLGYRNTANSYDGWTKQQFEQYIRDLVVFGANSIESIPIFEESSSPHFKVAPMEMNAFISSVCQKYALDYWMWVPAQFDIGDTAKRNKYLSAFEKICKQSVRINGVFFPGGDPGDNPPQTVIPFLKDIYAILKKYHPAGSIWLSLQGYTPEQNQYVYNYIRQEKPQWFGGLVTGPSSPTAEETRPQLPAKYKIRHYPDVTHNVRCEFEIPWWDPSFSFTLGREAVNPRPSHYTVIYHQMEPYVDGFISYSDGIHDDVNKILWTALSWNGKSETREIMKEYANYFFGSNVEEDAADAILALEKNWQGPMIANGSVSTTLSAWKQLEKNNPQLDSNWRWQMNLLRAYYDNYTRSRFIYENNLEQKANEQLLQSSRTGADSAMNAAAGILNTPIADTLMISENKKIVDLCEALFQSISLQTSVKKYEASGLERGAVLDFIDRPLNNKWWLEDEFKRIRTLPETEKIKELKAIATWEDPGPGGYYDQVGNISRSPHEMKGENWMTDPTLRKSGNPGYDFSDNGMSRKRLSWLTYMRWPLSLEYPVDTTAKYTVKISGLGESLLKINGQRVAPSKYGKTYAEIKEFPVPVPLIKSGKLILTWDELNEDFLNWRKQSRVCEVWLIKTL